MTRSQDHCSLIYSDGHSSKFWKLVLQGTSHTVTFGRLGTTGQTQTKQFASEEAAQKAFDKLRLEKLRKGYVSEIISPIPVDWYWKHHFSIRGLVATWISGS